MKVKRLFLVAMLFSFILATNGGAGDSDWVNDFNIMAEADPLEFRFRVGDWSKKSYAEINIVIGIGKKLAPYMVCRIAEMASKAVDYLI